MRIKPHPMLHLHLQVRYYTSRYTTSPPLHLAAFQLLYAPAAKPLLHSANKRSRGTENGTKPVP